MKNNIFYSLFFMLAFMLTLGKTNTFAGDVNLEVRNSNNDLLAGVNVYYNDYGNHYVLLGTTDDGTSSNPVVATLPDGNYKFKAVLNHTEQIKDNETVPGTVNFQTSEFVVHVKKSDDTNFPGIAVAFNDYGNHYLSMGTTDGSGNASIELFPGTRKFRATKDHTDVTGETSNTIEFQTSEFIVHVKKSDNSDFSGIAVAFNDYGNHYLSMGTTDGSGNASIELFPGTRTFRATKDHTDITGETSNTIEFQTAKAIGLVKDCDNNLLSDIKIYFNDYGSHWLFVGNTDVNGEASIELFPGTHSFKAWKDYTQSIKDLVLALTSSTVEFNPTTVTLQFSGTVQYNDYGNHWKTMTSPFYFFDGTYNFRFGKSGYPYGTKAITFSGCSVTQTVAYLRLKDHNGAALVGGTGRGGYNTPTVWHVSGSTDANGVLIDCRNGLLTNLIYEMKYNNTTKWSAQQDVSVNSFFDFQTDLLILRLETCGSSPLDGATMRYGNGGTYTTWFFPGGTTGNSSPGETAAEFFPGTYSFEAMYQATAQVKSSVAISGNTTLTWQTTNVTLHYSEQIAYGGSGDSRFFNKPTMELLPGDVNFNFRGGPSAYHTLTIPASCTFEKTIAKVLVNKCGGGLLDGVDIKWYKYGAGGTKYDVGTTDSAPLLNILDGYVNYNIVHVAGYFLQSNSSDVQNPSTESIFEFDTQEAIVSLVDHSGTEIGIDGDNDLKFYAQGHSADKYSMTLESGKGKQCLLPGNYVFSLKYNKTSTSSAVHNISDEYVFQTGAVINGSFNATKYYQFGFSANQGDFFDGIELLPVVCKFIGSSETRTYTVSAGQTLDLGDGSFSKIMGGTGSGTVISVPEVFKLYTNYPNPFNPTTTIKFTVKEANPTTLKVYNTLGQEIATLFNGTAEPGKFYQFEFNASNLGSGMYIYRLMSGDNVNVKQMILMK